MVKFTRKQIQLLKHSKVFHDYEILMQIFERFEDVSEEMLSQLTEKELRFVHNSLANIIELAEKEWKTDLIIAEDRGQDKSNYIRCSLCNQPNRYVFYIYNQLNGNQLNVGSDCIKQFGILGRDGLHYSTLIKDAKKNRLIYELDQLYSGIERIIKTWVDEIERHSFVIPSSIEEPYKNLGKQIKALFNDYINREIKIDEMTVLTDMLKKRQDYLDKMNEWASQQSNVEFCSRKKIGRWMITKGETTGLAWLKEDGRITQRTAHRITEASFMEELAAKLRLTYQDLGVEIWQPDADRKGYYVTIPPLTDVQLLCSHNILVKKYCGGYFGAEHRLATVKQILEICSLVERRWDYENLFDRIVKILRPNVSLYNSDYDRDFAIFHESNKFVGISLKGFTSEFMHLAYGENELKQEAINRIYDKKNPRYSWEEIHEFGYYLKK